MSFGAALGFDMRTVHTPSLVAAAAAAALFGAFASGCAGDKAPRNDTAAQAQAPTTTPATIPAATFDGVGRARIGTSLAQLRAIGAVPDAGAVAPGSTCRMVALDWLPAGVRVMLVNDSVVRVDVDSTSAVKTVDGAGVGDAEARLHQLYASIETQPNKYVATAHDLIVASPNDSTRRMVFETDGAVVKRYRVGRRPEVDFVEGCG